MAIPNVPDTDTFDIWRQKTNLIAQLEGDLTLLLTPVTTDLVAAINSILDLFEDDLRAMLIRAIAMG